VGDAEAAHDGVKHELPAQAGVEQQIQTFQIERRQEAAVEVAVFQGAHVERVAGIGVDAPRHAPARHEVGRSAEREQIGEGDRFVRSQGPGARVARQRHEVQWLGAAGAHDVEQDAALAHVLRVLVDVVGPGRQRTVNERAAREH